MYKKKSPSNKKKKKISQIFRHIFLQLFLKLHEPFSWFFFFENITEIFLFFLVFLHLKTFISWFWKILFYFVLTRIGWKVPYMAGVHIDKPEVYQSPYGLGQKVSIQTILYFLIFCQKLFFWWSISKRKFWSFFIYPLPQVYYLKNIFQNSN